jgi:sulfite reductase alpha subunit-like flavoprotein
MGGVLGMNLSRPEPGSMEGELCSLERQTRGKGETECWSLSHDTHSLVSCSRSTIFVRLHTNGNQELQYQPGDHLGVFPGNHEDLVNALIERLEDAPPANHVVKVEMLEERNTALGKASSCTS